MFDDDEADLGNQLEQTSTITANLIEATIPQDGSLLPGDLNSTNQIIVGVLELLESTIEDDNVTEVAPQVCMCVHACTCMCGDVIHVRKYQYEDGCLFIKYIKREVNGPAEKWMY